MKTYEPSDLKKILASHAMWLAGDADGVRADMSGSNRRLVARREPERR
jgi:hypothetical protein